MTDFEFVKEYIKRLIQLERRYEKAAEESVDIKKRVNEHLAALMQTEQELVMDDLESEQRDEITDFITEWRDKHA